jgi:hypothetical protein
MSTHPRELISQLFSTCYPDILSASMIGKGFERLFELADELEKDAPTARDNISTFLARCVVDEGQSVSYSLTQSLSQSLSY